MNIAMLTTWNSACGIAEYSKHLMGEFEIRNHNLLLLNNKLNIHTPRGSILSKQIFSKDLQKSIEKYRLGDFVATKVFGVYWWGENPQFDVDKAWLALNDFETRNGPIDVLIVQYQSSLYEPEGFNKFIEGVKCKKVITLHDSSRNKKHISFDKFDAVIVHNPFIEHTDFIPMPIIETIPIVFSFGMGGRNNYNFISEACGEVGVAHDFHDARENGWLSEEELFDKMNKSDAIVLWYNEVGIEGQSSALRTAISSMRPVIVNDVGWFKDAPEFVTKCSDKKSLQDALVNILHLDYIWANSYTNCAKKYLEVING